MRAPDNITIPELSSTWNAPTLDIKKPKDPKQLQGLLQAVSTMLQTPPAAPPPPMQTDNIAQRAAAMNQYQQFQQPQYPGFRYGGNVRAGQPIRVNEDGGMEGWRQRGQSDVVPIVVPPNAVVVPQTDGAVIPHVTDLTWLRKQQNRPEMDYRPGIDDLDAWGNPRSSPAARLGITQDGPSAQVLAPHQIAPQPVVLPTVTAPAPLPPSPVDAPTDNFGWNSDTPSMKAQREYDANRPPTVDEAWKNYDTVSAKKEHPNKFLSGLFLALQGLNKYANPNDKTPVVTLGDAQRNKKLTEAKALLDSTIRKTKFETDIAHTKALDENLKEDNRRLKKIAADNALTKTEAEKTKRRANFRKSHPYFSAKNATEADKNELAQFGETPETMGTYDFSKPDVHQVGGVTFKFNPNTQSYEDSGMPHDGSKALTEFTVKDADGVVYKYTTSNEKAASLKTQLVSAGLQIAATNARQESQHQFQAGENDKNRALRLQIATEAQKEVKTLEAALHSNNAQEAAAARERLVKLREHYKRLESGEEIEGEAGGGVAIP